MNTLQKLCIICQAAIKDGDYCKTCQHEYAAFIAVDPLPAWLIAAREKEYQRRRSERTEARHVNEPASDPDVFETLPGETEVNFTPGSFEALVHDAMGDKIDSELVLLFDRGCIDTRDLLALLNKPVSQYQEDYGRRHLSQKARFEVFNDLARKYHVKPCADDRAFRDLEWRARKKVEQARREGIIR